MVKITREKYKVSFSQKEQKEKKQDLFKSFPFNRTMGKENAEKFLTEFDNLLKSVFKNAHQKEDKKV